MKKTTKKGKKKVTANKHAPRKRIARVPVVAKAVPLVKSPRDYFLRMTFNGKTYETETGNLALSILSFKPRFLKTKILFIVRKGEKSFNKQVFLVRGKQLFRNRLSLDTFVRQMIFK